MRHLKPAVFGSAVLLLALACTDHGTNPLDEYRYPLAVGNRWVYERESRTFNVRPSPGVDASDLATLADMSRSTIEIVSSEELANGDIGFRFHEQLFENGDTLGSAILFSNRSDGFYYLAADGQQFAAPLSDESRRLAVGPYSFAGPSEMLAALTDGLTGHSGRSAGSKELTPLDPPWKSLNYPLKIGIRWIVRNPTGQGSPQIEKRVKTVDYVDVPAGQFTCAIVQRAFELKNSMDSFDYFGSPGLVRRNIVIHDVAFLNANGDTLGIADYEFDVRLVEYHVAHEAEGL